MLRLVITFCIFLLSAALGLLIAVLVLPDMSVSAASFVLDVAIFAVLRAIISPFIIKLTLTSARALAGAAGLVATLVALILTTLVTSGLSIKGLSTWVLATLITWLVSMFAAFLLPLLVVKGLLGASLRDAARPSGGGHNDALGQLL